MWLLSVDRRPAEPAKSVDPVEKLYLVTQLGPARNRC